MGIQPEIIRKLSSGDVHLWHAAHDDGSDNRINGETVAEAAGYSVFAGMIAAAAMWFRKKFRNRGKTRKDLEAEKEAAVINKTCGALEEMLVECDQAAQKNAAIDPELLDELIDTLEKMHGYYQSGKLVVPGEKELYEIRKSMEEYTAAITGDPSDRPARDDQKPDEDEFMLIRELLLKQRPAD